LQLNRSAAFEAEADAGVGDEVLPTALVRFESCGGWQTYASLAISFLAPCVGGATATWASKCGHHVGCVRPVRHRLGCGREGVRQNVCPKCAQAGPASG